MDIQDIARLNATEYKKYHESLMQNNHGTSAVHVFFCIFFTVQCSIYSSLKLRNVGRNQYLYEYLIIVLPLILAHTVLTNYIYVLNMIISTMLLYDLSFHFNKLTNLRPNYKSNRIVSISVIRGLTYLITVLAILAVDFQSFPRNLAKTERFGVSLMDTGVGLFVLISGLVHKDLRTHKLTDILKGNLKFITVLLILGIARYVSVKKLDYYEHVTEYGVHWNFFFTLAVCKILSTILLYFVSNTFLSSFLVLIVHEGLLYCGVQDWVFSDAPRDNLLSANREGVSSCLGYVSMYLFAANLKKMMIEDTAPIAIKIIGLPRIYVNTVQIVLILNSIFLWALFICINCLRPASRTLANAAYCICIESYLATVIAIMYFIETLLHDDKNKFVLPKILENVNSNGLSYFLVANLMTGAVNLSIRTLVVSRFNTFVILNAYMAVTLVLVAFLKQKGVKI